MLTIDAEPEVKSPAKLRKKRKSKGEVQDDGEVLRMQDFPVRPPPAPPDISKTPPVSPLRRSPIMPN